ncbi:Os05g0546700, partial [Oryza sativa Japonica Group]
GAGGGVVVDSPLTITTTPFYKKYILRNNIVIHPSLCLFRLVEKEQPDGMMSKQVRYSLLVMHIIFFNNKY